MTTSYEDMAALIGRRVELPVHYDLWARGARTGTIVSRRQGKPGQSAYVTVKMDHPQVKWHVMLWALDIEYARIEDRPRIDRC